MKRKSKYTCAQCEADTRVMVQPVRSSKLKKWFCNLECFAKYMDKK